MKILVRLLKIVFFCFIFFVIFNFGAFLIAKMSPKIQIAIANSFNLYDKNGKLYYQGSSAGEWIDLEDISNYLKEATISIEDKNFYRHNGFDFPRIIKAGIINVQTRSKNQGASTISQQYARNLYLDFEKTWKRKLEEMWLAFKLEAHYSKDEILEGYLNTINYGHGVYGIQNASRFYFGKDASKLTLAEASMLAGIPNLPGIYSPLINEKEANARQKLILNKMVEIKYITEAERKTALAIDLKYIGKKEQSDLSSLMYYGDAVFAELKTITSIPNSYMETGGLKIYTTLDIEAQTALEEKITSNLSNNEKLQVSAVMMDPDNGGIIALIGGKDYVSSQFNRAIASKRQPGSTIKSLLYYGALENGMTSSSTFTSEKTTFNFANDKTYSPTNYGDKYANSSITMAAALAFSDNIYAVKTHLFLGESVLVDIANRTGITETLEAIPSLALGSQEMSVIDLVTGYSALANEGNKVKAHLITKVENSSGKTLYKNPKIKENVLNKSYTFILSELLRNTYNPVFIDYTYPTCSSVAPKISKTYAIKTGSTDFDSWTVGYNKNTVLGIWTGYDDNSTITNNDAQHSKNIWVDTMEKYMENKENSWFSPPSNIVGVVVNPITGKIPKSDGEKQTILYYVKGTEPHYEDKGIDSLINSG